MTINVEGDTELVAHTNFDLNIRKTQEFTHSRNYGQLVDYSETEEDVVQEKLFRSHSGMAKVKRDEQTGNHEIDSE